jgi:hypothetical protein
MRLRFSFAESKKRSRRPSRHGGREEPPLSASEEHVAYVNKMSLTADHTLYRNLNKAISEFLNLRTAKAARLSVTLFPCYFNDKSLLVLQRTWRVHVLTTKNGTNYDRPSKL